MMTLLEKIMDFSHYYYGQFLNWYHASDLLTQYIVLTVSGIVLFLFSVTVVMSKITK